MELRSGRNISLSVEAKGLKVVDPRACAGPFSTDDATNLTLIRIDLVLWCSSLLRLLGRDFCTCRCSDAQVNEMHEAEVLRV
jgi:hypothetical protein